MLLHILSSKLSLQTYATNVKSSNSNNAPLRARGARRWLHPMQRCNFTCLQIAITVVCARHEQHHDYSTRNGGKKEVILSPVESSMTLYSQDQLGVGQEAGLVS